MDPAARRSLVRCLGFVALLHVVGWGLLVGVIAPRAYHLGSAEVFGVGLGVTAYTLGMRHAFDADHIAAIDNTTRKLMSDGQRPVTVGFWFSLGHSSVVLIMVTALGLGVRAIADGVSNDHSALASWTSTWGTTVSGLFLVLIGLINLVALVGIARVLLGMRRGTFDDEALERHLASRGFLVRVLARVTATVKRPWHMYPVGFLFGLGFDTVTEVGLLVIAGGAVAGGVPWWTVLVLPILFAAGMALLDTIDGAFMNLAYGWAFSRPLRKVYYNLSVTALSVAVALAVGGVELVGLVVSKAGITSGPLAAIGRINLESAGYGIVALFAVVWLTSLGVWKFGRLEERWAPDEVTGL